MNNLILEILKNQKKLNGKESLIMKKRAEILFMAVLMILTGGFLVDHFSMAQSIFTENSPDGVLYLNQ